MNAAIFEQHSRGSDITASMRNMSVTEHLMITINVVFTINKQNKKKVGHDMKQFPNCQKKTIFTDIKPFKVISF